MLYFVVNTRANFSITVLFKTSKLTHWKIIKERYIKYELLEKPLLSYYYYYCAFLDPKSFTNNILTYYLK